MSFPYKLYKKLSKLDFVTGLGHEDKQLVLYVAHDLNDEETRRLQMVVLDRKIKVVVSLPITGA